MKKLALLLVLIFALSIIASCSGSNEGSKETEKKTENEKETEYENPNSIEYDDTVEVKAITDAINEKIGAGLYQPEDEFFASDFDLSCVDSFAVFISLNGTVDRYGVFKAKNLNERSMFASSVEAYLENLQKTWMTDYDPNDTVKLQNAGFSQRGLYVVFWVLGEEDSTVVRNNFENMIKRIEN